MPSVRFRLNGAEMEVDADPDRSLLDILRGQLGMTGPHFGCGAGEYGALLFDGESVFSAPAFPVEDVADPTGAGDTFAGGLLGYLAREDRVDGVSLRRAVIYGSVIASFSVEGVSVDRLVQVSSSDVASRYAAFARLAHFASDAELR